MNQTDTQRFLSLMLLRDNCNNPFNFLDSDLDQAFVDALPVFLYKEIIGLKEPFDCAVCLSEFSEQDKLRLLPNFSHAFHIDCIGTWLLSNSTCPLCRGNLYTPGVVGLSIENPVFCFEDPREEDGFSSNGASGFLSGQKPAENAIIGEKSVFSVGIGKFRRSNDGVGAVVERGVGETSSSSLDARCYSLGSYQYVVADSELQVALCPNRVGGSMRIVKGRGTNGTSTIDGIGDGEGKKINTGSKGVVFLFLRSGSSPLVHPLLLWLCHGQIDYRVHHEGIQCAFYFFALCQIVNRSISQKLFPSFLNEWIIPYLNAGLCEWCSFF